MELHCISCTLFEQRWIAGTEQTTFTDSMEFLMTWRLWTNAVRLVSTTTLALPSTGNQATPGKLVGF